MANTSRITALMHWLQAGAPGPDSFLQVVAEIGGRLNAAGVPAAQVASAWPRRRSLKPAAHMYASPIVFGFSAPCDETISSKAEKCSVQLVDQVTRFHPPGQLREILEVGEENGDRLVEPGPNPPARRQFVRDVSRQNAA